VSVVSVLICRSGTEAPRPFYERLSCIAARQMLCWRVVTAESNIFYDREQKFRAYSVIRPPNPREERMTKFRLIGAAAVFFSVLAGPAMARPVIHPGQSIFCATREAGNPYSKYCDYLAWSGWRRRGGWDSSLDNACGFNPHYVPYGCVPFQSPLPGGY